MVREKVEFGERVKVVPAAGVVEVMGEGFIHGIGGA